MSSTCSFADEQVSCYRTYVLSRHCNAAVYQTWSRCLGHIVLQWSPWSSDGKNDYVLTRQLIVVDVTAVFMGQPLLVLLCLCVVP
jgi:hypothetical protein